MQKGRDGGVSEGIEVHRLTPLPPSPDRCQECAVAHDPAAPHNRDSLYYTTAFYLKHGRWPTWTDAMAHCDEETKAMWREELTLMGVAL